MFNQSKKTFFTKLLTGNRAGPEAAGGGAYAATLYNCIVVGNEVEGSADLANYCSSILNYCCATPLATNGAGNFTNAPLFADAANGNFRLQPDSPCINAGNNDYVTTTTDLNGNPRISGGTVDVGAYEFVFTPSMNVARLVLLVKSSDLGAKDKQSLIATLFAAMASFDRGNTNAGINQLGAFQNKVRAQVAPSNSVLANELIAASHQIIEVVNGP